MSLLELKGGLLVDEEAIKLALALETSGILLTARDGVLIASPASALTPARTADIRRLKRHLLAIAAYVPPA